MRVLIAGATGYLGKYITEELISQEYETKAIVRNKKKLQIESPLLEIVHAEVTKLDSLNNICNDVDVVISSIGITRQKDGLTYMDVDYQANLNLLNQAKKSGVKKFIYVSVFNGEKMRHLKMCEAKEKFVDELKNSDIDYCVVRPTGFFSDMLDMLTMAKKGRIYLFGNGELELNPIHGKDLAKEIVNFILESKVELSIGGPDVFTQRELAELAFDSCRKSVKITYIPDFIRRFLSKILRYLTPLSVYGPVEFFLKAMGMSMVAPICGEHHLAQFFAEEVRKDKDIK